MRKILCILIICILVMFLASCEEVPEYKDLGKDPQKGNMLEVNSVIYRALPDTDWRPLDWMGMKLVAKNKEDDRDSNVYMYSVDTRQIFVMQRYSDNKLVDPAYANNYFYREDVTLPPYDRSGIDTIGFRKNQFSSYHTIQKKELIDQLFILKTNSQNREHDGGFGSAYEMQLMNSSYPGIGIDASIYQKDKTYWIFFNSFYAISPISQDLLEQIAGEKLPEASE